MNKKSVIAFLLLITTPIVTYLWIFGFKISTDHTRWGEFGSAFGGIYAPLIAILTLFVVRRQVLLQSQMNEHEYDQGYLHQAREDIEFYSIQMSQVMNSVVQPGKTLRNLLNENFHPANATELDSQTLRQLAANIHEIIPSSIDIWGAIYPILTGLATGKGAMYVMTHGSSIQKLIALLSFESCVALDNLYRTRTEGRLQINYFFSSLLVKK